MTSMSRNSYWLYKHKINKYAQHFKKFFILDFEATCDNGYILNPQEIIEFPCLVANSTDFEIEAKFHRYVKPRIHPRLTPFCTELTGITQSQVNAEPEFSVVYDEFLQFLRTNFDSIPSGEAIFVTCGNWDIQMMLPQQCKLSNLKIPEQLHRWINLKTAFFQGTGYYPRGIVDMHKHLNIPMKGRLHSGIDDCHAILAIMSQLADKRVIFEQTNQL